jgi:AcrR family transcriptional regulator
MPKGIPLTPPEQALRRQHIFAAAVHLFIEKGFLETSLREIAAAAGMGKSTLYDYFKTKDDILVSYFEDEMLQMTATAAEISQKGLPAGEKLRQIMQVHLAFLMAKKNHYLRLSGEAQRLGRQPQVRLQTSRHAYQDLICRLIETGIAEGSFRAVDPYLAMRVILSALTPLVFTSRPSGSPQKMLDGVLDILYRGISV